MPTCTSDDGYIIYGLVLERCDDGTGSFRRCGVFIYPPLNLYRLGEEDSTEPNDYVHVSYVDYYYERYERYERNNNDIDLNDLLDDKSEERSSGHDGFDANHDVDVDGNEEAESQCSESKDDGTYVI
jgi:hypothetical protein